LIHKATPSFWKHYNELPKNVQKRAEKAFKQLKANPSHPSLRFKNVGELWSARVSKDYRALALESGDGFDWVWIGLHSEYNKLIK
jgi:mRNA-degrading endonuclease RelE of RelBE toxin-antitoxin system